MGYRSVADGAVSKGKTKGKMLAKGGAVKMASGGSASKDKLDRSSAMRRMADEMTKVGLKEVKLKKPLDSETMKALKDFKNQQTQKEGGPFKKGGMVKPKMRKGGKVCK